jgi:hypothetical protein
MIAFDVPTTFLHVVLPGSSVDGDDYTLYANIRIFPWHCTHGKFHATTGLAIAS